MSTQADTHKQAGDRTADDSIKHEGRELTVVGFTDGGDTLVCIDPETDNLNEIEVPKSEVSQ